MSNRCFQRLDYIYSCKNLLSKRSVPLNSSQNFGCSKTFPSLNNVNESLKCATSSPTEYILREPCSTFPTLSFKNYSKFLILHHYDNLLVCRQLHLSTMHRDIYIIKTEEEFEIKVMGSKLPVIINFHADWCEPCHELKPLLQSLAEQFKGKLHLAEVLVDEHVDLLHTFQVTAVPAVLGVVGGQVKEKFVGLISEAEVRAFVNTMIGE